MKIERLTATPVTIPTRPNSIQSAEIDADDWSKSPDAAHFPKGGTAQIQTLVKYVLRAFTGDGSVGLGESYRAVELERLKRNGRALMGIALEELPLKRLPLPFDREYHGFELLVYDLVGKRLGCPVHRLLGGPFRKRVECSTWSGRRTVREAGEKALEGLRKGFDCIKFKCNLEDDVVAWAREIEALCGSGMRVILDPNQRWGEYPAAYEIMKRLARSNVMVIEDPVDRRNLDAYRRLRGIGSLNVARHVALGYVDHGQRAEDALAALQADAVDGFNFSGPMAEFVRLADLADLAGKPCWHGSEVDCGILEAGYVHAAASAPACTWPSDIFGRLVREHDLLVEPLRFEGKYVRVPQGPGLGIALDLEALEKYRAGPDIDLLK